MREVVIVSAVRTPVGKAYKGTLRATRPDDLAAYAIMGALKRVPQLDTREIDDVVIGCAMPEAEQGMNVARIAALRAGLPVETSAMTVNRFCSSGLQAIAIGANAIACNQAEVVIAGGTESMTMIPMGGNKVSANPSLVQNYPDAYLSMGLTAERLATRFGITREQADEFSYQSHQKALKAIAEGKFEDEIVPVPVSTVAFEPIQTKTVSAAGVGAKMKRHESEFKIDEGPRADTTPEALASLKPAFHVKGTVTAGNSSQMSDGAAAVIVMSAEKAKALGLKPLARFVAFATAGYKPEEMGLGPGLPSIV
jgi:acetyl-CoA acyltransferase